MVEPMRDAVRPTRTGSPLRCRLLLLCLAGAATIAPAQMQSGAGQSAPAADSANPATVSGRVVNASNGLPVARALVRLNDRAILTTYDGKFEFDEVTGTDANLEANKPGFYPSIEPGGSSGIFLHTGQATTGLELRLYPEAIFTGTVTAPDGDPLPNILVSARRSMFSVSGRTWIPVAQIQTDSHGRYRVAVPSGDYKLMSAYSSQINGTDQAVLPVVLPAEDSSSPSSSIHIRSGEEQRLDLHPVTSRAHAVAVTFDVDLGHSFPRITARSSSGVTLSPPVRMQSGATRIELPNGTYTLGVSTFSNEGIEQGETNVTVAGRDVSGVVFHLAPLPKLPVELQVDSAAAAENRLPSLLQLGLMLESDQADADSINSSVFVTAERGGPMSFAAPPGSYRLRARNDNGDWYIKSVSYGTSDLLQQEIVVAPGSAGTPILVTVSNQTASLQGTCKLGGAPAACWVYLIPTTSSATTVFSERSNEQGIYNYAHLPPGSYQAIAFEQRHSADYSDPASLTPFATHVRSITVNVGEKPTLDLDTVPEAEMAR
ncbi:MAG TPA: carboxypeptidase-like regulatory domain-containing protein [Edaphobacter sp.]|nr:carboxypeptidase-like regulatory domain-containing protein [Edaphobacter sp.]